MSQDTLNQSQYFYNCITSITGILTVILLVCAFYLQNRQLKIAKQALFKNEIESNRKQFEDNFYLFLKIYRDNVKDMKSAIGGDGREVFVSLKNEFEEIFNIVKLHVGSHKKTNNLHNLIEQDIIKISYTILFFGIGENSNLQVKNSLKGYEVYIDDILSELSEKKKNSKFLFDGHQSRLGHYFRHLFQTVSFVHDTKLLTSIHDKKFYMRRLRGQLSTFELSILFLNSFTSFGSIWKSYKGSNGKLVDLISEYELIKNIPTGFFRDLDHKTYFPNIKYEGDV